MPSTHNLNISNQTLQVGVPTSLVEIDWVAPALVNIVAGQSLTQTTLTADGSTGSYPVAATNQINVTVHDSVGNQFPVVVTYTGTSGSTFTGCTAQNADPTLVTILSVASPNYSGVVQINRTGSGNHPWLDTLTSASSLTCSIQWSQDAGTTWQEIGSTTWQGGVQTDKFGNHLTVDNLGAAGFPPATNAARVVCTAGGTAVEVGGQVTVTSA